jgi:hypothetical protein
MDALAIHLTPQLTLVFAQGPFSAGLGVFHLSRSPVDAFFFLLLYSIVNYPVWDVLPYFSTSVSAGINSVYASTTASLNAVPGLACPNCLAQVKQTFCSAAYLKCDSASNKLGIPPCNSVCNDILDTWFVIPSRMRFIYTPNTMDPRFKLSCLAVFLSLSSHQLSSLSTQLDFRTILILASSLPSLPCAPLLDSSLMLRVVTPTPPLRNDAHASSLLWQRTLSALLMSTMRSFLCWPAWQLKSNTLSLRVSLSSAAISETSFVQDARPL